MNLYILVVRYIARLDITKETMTEFKTGWIG
jgi:hypothetical protein